LLAVWALVSAPAAAQPDPTDPAAADTIGPRLYPRIGFAILEQDERRVFVDLAEAELCPCPGPPTSLSSCLQQLEDRCRLAENVASLMIRQIKEDASPEDIADAIVRFVTEAQTQVSFDLDQAPRLGSATAPVRLVVFSDFMCPACRRFSGLVEGLTEEFGDDLAIYFKHFPLPQHRHAARAAQAAIAAGRQGHFWEMHDVLFARQDDLRRADDPDEILLGMAEDLGLDLERFARDLDDPSGVELTRMDRDEGRAAGVNSTPTVFINGVRFGDSETRENLRATIDELR
jgi:protein-disulfide isomerase